jgi:hypothetical protein
MMGGGGDLRLPFRLRLRGFEVRGKDMILPLSLEKLDLVTRFELLEEHRLVGKPVEINRKSRLAQDLTPPPTPTRACKCELELHGSAKELKEGLKREGELRQGQQWRG